VSLPVAVTVTTTPSGSGGIELEHMEHAVDPSRCATNVPQDHCSGSVPPDHDGGPKPLTCANTAGATGLEPTTYGFKMNMLDTCCLSLHDVAQNVPFGPSSGRFGRA
jgi:hypothetical protein